MPLLAKESTILGNGAELSKCMLIHAIRFEDHARGIPMSPVYVRSIQDEVGGDD